MPMPRMLVLLLAAALAPRAEATVIYKSVSPTGVIQFSDTPPDEHSRLIEQRDLGKPQAPVMEILPATTTPMEALVADDVVARATAQVDLAEHALALARRAVWAANEGIHLRGPRRTAADEERIEYYKHNVLLARQALLETMKQRATVVASRGATVVAAR
ncbi:MAG TPA: DUF4124 domain-containing protein [Usitatibacter sp.]|nr:DUF4124 domain-containing protein [Usitatibacter sp.]